jgi:hypothetical protein
VFFPGAAEHLPATCLALGPTLTYCTQCSGTSAQLLAAVFQDAALWVLLLWCDTATSLPLSSPLATVAVGYLGVAVKASLNMYATLLSLDWIVQSSQLGCDGVSCFWPRGINVARWHLCCSGHRCDVLKTDAKDSFTVFELHTTTIGSPLSLLLPLSR